MRAFLATSVRCRTRRCPVHIYGKLPDRCSTSISPRRLVSSGRYIVTEWKPDDHVIMVSNHTWWHGRPYIDEVYFKEYQNEQAQQIALQNGDVDMPFQLDDA